MPKFFENLRKLKFLPSVRKAEKFYILNEQAKDITKEELKQILVAFKRIENKEFDAFLTDVSVRNLKGKTYLKGLFNEDNIDSFIADTDGSISVNAHGPFGRYYGLADAKIFEKIADAAPYATFDGSIEGAQRTQMRVFIAS